MEWTPAVFVCVRSSDHLSFDISCNRSLPLCHRKPSRASRTLPRVHQPGQLGDYLRRALLCRASRSTQCVLMRRSRLYARCSFCQCQALRGAPDIHIAHRPTAYILTGHFRIKDSRGTYEYISASQPDRLGACVSRALLCRASRFTQ